MKKWFILVVIGSLFLTAAGRADIADVPRRKIVDQQWVFTGKLSVKHLKNADGKPWMDEFILTTTDGTVIELPSQMADGTAVSDKYIGKVVDATVMAHLDRAGRGYLVKELIKLKVSPSPGQ